MKKIGIIGGGISGLYLANILNNNPNFDYQVFERKSNFNFSEGYGIQLSVNSIKLLNKLNFNNLSAFEVCFPTKVNFFNSNNPKKICDINLSQFNDDQNRYTTTKRSTLLKFLLENIPKEKIKFKVTLTHVEEGENIKVYFSDNSQEYFDFLIIADGIFSQSKSIILNKSFRPKYNNSIAIRAKLKECNFENISIFMGSNFHYVTYPINQNNEYNFVAILKKKLTTSDLNYNKNSPKEFKNLLKEILNKNSKIKFENLSEIKAFPFFVSKSFPNIKQKNIFFFW